MKYIGKQKDRKRRLKYLLVLSSNIIHKNTQIFSKTISQLHKPVF